MRRPRRARARHRRGRAIRAIFELAGAAEKGFSRGSGTVSPRSGTARREPVPGFGLLVLGQFPRVTEVTLGQVVYSRPAGLVLWYWESVCSKNRPPGDASTRIRAAGTGPLYQSDRCHSGTSGYIAAGWAGTLVLGKCVYMSQTCGHHTAQEHPQQELNLAIWVLFSMESAAYHGDSLSKSRKKNTLKLCPRKRAVRPWRRRWQERWNFQKFSVRADRVPTVEISNKILSFFL